MRVRWFEHLNSSNQRTSGLCDDVRLLSYRGPFRKDPPDSHLIGDARGVRRYVVGPVSRFKYSETDFDARAHRNRIYRLMAFQRPVSLPKGVSCRRCQSMGAVDDRLLPKQR